LFNVLAYSKELEEAGFSRNQAEATINVIFKFMDHNFATKSDLSNAKNELKAEIAELRNDFTKLRFEFSSLENRMMIKFGLMQAATIGILAAVIKLL
jgi:predicted nuclease with TOPRIM domain